MDARMPSWAKRGMSSGWTCWACSMRQRWSSAPPAEFEDGLVEVEDFAVCAVADGVRVDLVAVLDGDVRGAGDVLDGFQHQPGRLGHVLVRFQQPGTVRPERPVDLALDGAHGQVVVALGRHVVVGQTGVHLFVGLAAHHDVETDRERALVFQSFEPVNGGKGRARVLERGDALGERLLGGERDLAAELRLDLLRGAAGLGAGEGGGHRALGGFAEQAGEVAVRVAHELSAGRGLGIAVVAGGGQGGGVGEGGMAGGVAEEHRVVRADRGEGSVGRVALDCGVRRTVPLLLVPAAPAYPLTGPRRPQPRRPPCRQSRPSWRLRSGPGSSCCCRGSCSGRVPR